MTSDEKIIQGLCEHIEKLEARIVSLETTLATAREEQAQLVVALEFYADLSAGEGTHPCDVDVRFLIDMGEKARAALNKLEEKSDG